MSATKWGPGAQFADVVAPAVQAQASGAALSYESVFGPSLPRNAGPAVTDRSAMMVPTVYGCLEKLGGAVGQLPLHQYRLATDGEREPVEPKSALWWLLNESPSPAWTAFSWKDWIVRCVALRGDQHTEIVRDRFGNILELIPHHPDRVVPTLKNRRLTYAVWDEDLNTVRGVDQDDMLHFTGYGFDGERSMSAIKWAARQAVANALGAANYMGKTVGEGGMPRISLEYPNKLDSDQAELLRKSFIEIYGSGDGAKLPLVMTQGGKAHELSISPVDLQLLESRSFDKGEISNVLGVPLVILGDTEKASSWGTGIEQIILGWVKFVIQPKLARWEEELNRKLFRRAGQFVEFNLAALLRGDTKTQSEAFRQSLGGPGTGDGWLTVNQVRRLLNMPRDPSPEADQLYRAPRDKGAAPAA